MKETKVIFMGTPDFAVPILETLIKNTNVVLVVSQPDKKVGRKRELKATPVKRCALEHNIDVFQPTNIKEDHNKILNTQCDIIITCAYGQIIPETLLQYPKLGCINVHASLLPKLRGGAPIHKAIIDNYEETGITIMYMDKKMDSGDIISQKSLKIEDNDNVGIMHDKLSKIGANLLIETLPSIINGTNDRVKQDESKVTYAYNISRDEERIDFNKNSKLIIKQILGLNPWPLANIILDGKECKIIEAYSELGNFGNIGIISDIKKDEIGINCGDGRIYITKIKPFGKKIMDVKSYINGIDSQKLIGSKINEEN